jgi:hypothetical protein
MNAPAPATPTQRAPADIVAELEQFGFAVRLAGDGAPMVWDMRRRPAEQRWPRSPPTSLMMDFAEHAVAIARFVERRGGAPGASGDPADPDGYLRPAVAIRRWTSHDADGVETAHARLLYGPPRSRRAIAAAGRRRFEAGDWATRALAAGWTAEELYRLPPHPSRLDLTGAVHLIGDDTVVEIAADAITLETSSGARLKLRRQGREHIA